MGVTVGEEAGEAGEAGGTRAGAGLWAMEDELEEREEPEEAGRRSWRGGWRRSGRSDETGGVRAGVGEVVGDRAGAGGVGVVRGAGGEPEGLRGGVCRRSFMLNRMTCCRVLLGGSNRIAWGLEKRGRSYEKLIAFRGISDI